MSSWTQQFISRGQEQTPERGSLALVGAGVGSIPAALPEPGTCPCCALPVPCLPQTPAEAGRGVWDRGKQRWSVQDSQDTEVKDRLLSSPGVQGLGHHHQQGFPAGAASVQAPHDQLCGSPRLQLHRGGFQGQSRASDILACRNGLPPSMATGISVWALHIPTDSIFSEHSAAERGLGLLLTLRTAQGRSVLSVALPGSPGVSLSFGGGWQR